MNVCHYVDVLLKPVALSLSFFPDGATDILDEDAHDIELSGQQKLKAENADESGRFINDGFICEAGEIQQTEDVNGEDYTRCGKTYLNVCLNISLGS